MKQLPSATDAELNALLDLIHVALLAQGRKALEAAYVWQTKVNLAKEEPPKKKKE